MVRYSLAILLCATLMNGCGHSQPKVIADGVVVDGQVTWKGKPLKWGNFVLTDPKDITRGASVDIEDGKFVIGPERRLPPGTYLVQIFGGMRHEDNPLVSGPETEDTPREVLPPQHNLQSKQTIEIKATGNRNLRFDLN